MMGRMLLDTLLAAGAHATGRLVPGLALGILAGGGLAVLAARTRTGLAWLAVVPELLLVTAWFSPAVAVVATCAALPLHTLTYGALRRQDTALAEAMRTLPLTPHQTFRHVVLPGALPRVFLGVRVGAVTAVLGLLAVETLGAADALVPVTVLAVGVVALLAVRRVERRVLAWR